MKGTDVVQRHHRRHTSCPEPRQFLRHRFHLPLFQFHPANYLFGRIATGV